MLLLLLTFSFKEVLIDFGMSRQLTCLMTLWVLMENRHFSVGHIQQSNNCHSGILDSILLAKHKSFLEKLVIHLM